MSDYMNIWVISETPQDYLPLCALARKIGEVRDAKISALWIGDAEGAHWLQSSGVHTVYFAKKDEQEFFGNSSVSLVDLIEKNAPDVILLATSKNMRLFAAQAAARLKTRVLNDVTAFSLGEGKLFAEHMVYGGSALRRELVKDAPALMLLAESLLLTETVGGDAAAPTSFQAELVELSCDRTQDIELVSRKAREVEAVNLAGAPIVVSVGRGVESEADLQLIYDLATTLQGEVGCTRPIAEGMKWMSHERYIGVSGAMLKPTLFIAVGLSGQIQHMVGANRAKTIVAINKDKNAPIFKQADYGIVGDLYEVLPRLNEALK